MGPEFMPVRLLFMTQKKVVVFWFRRDLRLVDNNGLTQALQLCRDSGAEFFPLFIFDKTILSKLRSEDARVTFIFNTVTELKKQLKIYKVELNTFFDEPKRVFEQVQKHYQMQAIIANGDYEPTALKRDEEISQFAQQHGSQFLTFKDQVVFEKQDVQTDAGKPYTVFTPYKKKWLATLNRKALQEFKPDFTEIKAARAVGAIEKLEDLGFKKSMLAFPDKIVTDKIIKNYAETRNCPALNSGTSHLGLHLRFGTVSVRRLVDWSSKLSEVWLSELIWREFFMQILWNFPHVQTKSFRPIYENIKWRNDNDDFKRWKAGETGYPLVDAGLRQLVATGHMHNRVRMVTASFLTKHLLQHWLYGERFFAEHLLDYDLSANNGNWQWAAGTGCDAAPYFRVFNPQTQAEKFDPNLEYIKKWVPEYGTKKYPEPMVDHKLARVRCLRAYKEGLGKTDSVILEGDLL